MYLAFFSWCLLLAMATMLHSKKPQPVRAFPKPAKSNYQAGEIKLHGLHACLSVFCERPDDIVKVYLHESKLQALGDVMRWCVKKRLAYKIVSDVELKKLTESVHHEGVCFIVRDKPSLTFPEFLQILKSQPQDKPVVLPFLDGVQNSHNVGNILRTCAHFGVKFVLIADPEFQTLPPSTHRVSEGGSEFVNLVMLKNAVQDLQTLKTLGFAILSTSSHASKSLWQLKLPKKSVMVLGSETNGVSKPIENLATMRVLIAGTGDVESLNVASAQAVLLAEFARQHHV